MQNGKSGLMGLHHCRCWALSLLLLHLMLCGCQCMSVHIQTKQPVYVIPGYTLVLQVNIDRVPGEQVSMVTWEQEPKSGKKVTLAKFPGDTPKGRVTLEQQGATLRLEGLTKADYGRFTVTVSDRNGSKATAQCVVEEYVAVHHVSVAVNSSHSSLYCDEAWGTEPRFTWLHERAVIPDEVGRVSPDGRILYVSHMPLCGHFTCTVSNRLGHSSATYTAAAACVGEGKGTAVAVTCLVLLLVTGGALAFLLWRRHKRLSSNRGERLQEHF